MIQKSGDYYVYEDTEQTEKTSLSPRKKQRAETQTHQVVGNVKQKIQAIRERFTQIKLQKQQFQKSNLKKGSSIFKKLNAPAVQQLSTAQIQLYIPEQILKLEQKLSIIEERLNPNEILRRKMEKKGTLVDRIKQLQQKLKSILEKSSQIIVNNIQTYCASLDDKEEYLKILFLREAHTKVNGMKEEILVLEQYMKNLNSIQKKVNAVQPIQKTINTHAEVIQLRNSLSKKISKLFESMKKTYTEILGEIDSISV